MMAGHGTDSMDRHGAITLYQRAADQGLPAARFFLGEAARDGVLAPYSLPEDNEYIMGPDEEAAFGMFAEAAGQGYMRAKPAWKAMAKARAAAIIVATNAAAKDME
jgi:TPR repeat protein